MSEVGRGGLALVNGGVAAGRQGWVSEVGRGGLALVNDDVAAGMGGRVMQTGTDRRL